MKAARLSSSYEEELAGLAYCVGSIVESPLIEELGYEEPEEGDDGPAGCVGSMACLPQVLHTVSSAVRSVPH